MKKYLSLFLILALLVSGSAYGQAATPDPIDPGWFDRCDDGGSFDGNDGFLNGLPTFDEAPSLPGFVMRAGLREDANTETGWGTNPTFNPSPPDGSTAVDSVRGTTFDGASGIRYNMSNWPGVDVLLQTSGTIGFELERTFNIENPATGTSYITSAGGTNSWLQWETSGTMRSFWLRTSASPFMYLSEDNMGPDAGLGTHMQVHLTWDATDTCMFIDGVEIFCTPRDRATSWIWANIGGLSATVNAVGSWGDRRVRNYFLAHGTPNRRVTTESIAFLGDSFSVGGRGCSPAEQAQSATVTVVPWATTTGGSATGTNTGCGFASFDLAAYSAAASNGAGAFLYTGSVIRSLAASGLYTSNNLNYAGSGASGLDGHVQDQIDLIDADGETPTIIVAAYGANDIAAGGSPGVDECPNWDQAAFELGLQNVITKAHEMGVKRVVGWYPPTVTQSSVDDDQGCIDAVLEAQTAVANVVAWSVAQGYGSKFFVAVDGFNTMGGIDGDPDLFDPDDLHLNKVGQKLMADIIAAGILE